MGMSIEIYVRILKRFALTGPRLPAPLLASINPYAPGKPRKALHMERRLKKLCCSAPVPGVAVGAVVSILTFMLAPEMLDVGPLVCSRIRDDTRCCVLLCDFPSSLSIPNYEAGGINPAPSFDDYNSGAAGTTGSSPVDMPQWVGGHRRVINFMEETNMKGKWEKKRALVRHLLHTSKADGTKALEPIFQAEVRLEPFQIHHHSSQ
jgi:hypothetical protein